MPKIVDHEARRRDFIEAAYQSILENGLAKTTIRGVAQRAGYTSGALVHYFSDKDELLRHALEENGNVIRQRMLSLQAENHGRQALREVLIEALPTDKNSDSRWRIWLAMWYHSEETGVMRREEKRRYKEWLGRITEILQESVDMGELSTATNLDEEAKRIVALTDGIGVQYLMAAGRYTAAEVIALLDGYLERLYRNEPD